MNFKKKASALALCAVLLGTSIAPVSAATHEVIRGKDRYETAAQIADKMGNYDTAILVNSDKSLADGLSASSLAGKENAPILLAKQNKLPEATAKKLEQVKKVYIIGGEKAIGKEVEAELAGKEIIRIEGKDRMDTSKRVAELLGDYKTAFVVNGIKGEADAMSVAALAAREKAPIILTDGKTISDVKKDAYHYLIGGPDIISIKIDEYLEEHLNKEDGFSIYESLYGMDRYDTNRVIIERFYKAANKLYFTEGTKLVDALTVSSLAKDNGVVLVSEKSDKAHLKNRATMVQVGSVKDSIVKDIFKGEFTADKRCLRVGHTDINIEQGEKIDRNLFEAYAADIDGRDISDEIVLDGNTDSSVLGDHFITLRAKLSNGEELTMKVCAYVYEASEDDAE